MNSLVSQIEAALGAHKPRAYDSFQYALYLSLGMSELCDEFFVHLANTPLRNNIFKHILVRRDRRGEKVPRRFIAALLTRFATSSKRTRISLGTALKDLADSLAKEQLRQFFLLQVSSEYVLDRKRAYSIAARIYDRDVDNLLWDSWHRYRDDGCMDVLASFSSGERLANEFADVWQSPDLRFFIKNSVLKRVARHDFALVAFLKNDAPISYLSACVAAGKPISDDEASAFAKTADSLRSFQYVLWCLGMLGKREALYALLPEASEIESRMPAEFWEASFFEHASHEPSQSEG